MEIKVGQIIKVKHIGDDFKIYIHPFLIVNITKNNIFGLQCSSVKIKDNNSYFSKNNIKYWELVYSALDYVTHVRLDYFEKIKSENIIGIECDPEWKDYNRIAQELLLIEWENTKWFNSKEIHNHVRKGINNFKETWEI